MSRIILWKITIFGMIVNVFLVIIFSILLIFSSIISIYNFFLYAKAIEVPKKYVLYVVVGTTAHRRIFKPRGN